MTTTSSSLDLLLIRKDNVLCVRCCKAEPINPGHGTPARTFVYALEMMAARHARCLPPEAARKPKGGGR